VTSAGSNLIGQAAPRMGEPDGVYVTFENPEGNPIATSFSLAVFC
jgi:hypothetical protein